MRRWVVECVLDTFTVPTTTAGQLGQRWESPAQSVERDEFVLLTDALKRVRFEIGTRRVLPNYRNQRIFDSVPFQRGSEVQRIWARRTSNLAAGTSGRFIGSNQKDRHYSAFSLGFYPEKSARLGAVAEGVTLGSNILHVLDRGQARVGVSDGYSIHTHGAPQRI
jgi:hypothetical protein